MSNHTQKFSDNLRHKMWHLAKDLENSMSSAHLGGLFQNKIPVTDQDIENEMVLGFLIQAKISEYLTEVSSLRQGTVISVGPVAKALLPDPDLFHITVKKDDRYGAVISLNHRGIKVEATQNAYAHGSPILQLMMAEAEEAAIKLIDQKSDSKG